MPLLDLLQFFGDLRADRDQGRTLRFKRRVELPLVIGQRQIAGRTAGEAEKDQHDRAVAEQGIEHHRAAIDLRQGQGLDNIAGFDEFAAVCIFDKIFPLIDIDCQVLRLERRHAVRVKIGE